MLINKDPREQKGLAFRTALNEIVIGRCCGGHRQQTLIHARYETKKYRSTLPTSREILEGLQCTEPVKIMGFEVDTARRPLRVARYQPQALRSTSIVTLNSLVSLFLDTE